MCCKNVSDSVLEEGAPSASPSVCMMILFLCWK